MSTIFPNAPMLRPITNDKWLVEETFICIHKVRIITIKKGFETDGASIPNTPLVRWIIGHPFSMPLLPCALIHDALYAGELVSRSEADWMFLELMKRAKINWFKRNTVWSAVRTGGAICWARHTIDKILDARKHCSIAKFNKPIV